MRVRMGVMAALLMLLSVHCALAWDEAGLIALAKSSIKAEVRGEQPPSASTSTPPRPVFVTIERKGRVIGCRGDLSCRTRSLESEVIQAARSAASHDPRYTPLKPKDLLDFNVTVTIVERLDPIESIDGLQPCDGLVLKSGGRTGVVLPWEGKDPELRLKWAYTKAGVRPNTPCRLYRLKAERFRG